MRRCQHLPIFVVFASIAVLGGCMPLGSSQLAGRWEGTPDSAAAYRDRQEFSQLGQAATVAVSKTDDPKKTVLEQQEIRIQLELQSDGSVAMWRGDGQDRLTGTWTVLESHGRHARLQLAVEREQAAADAPEVRNFQIEFVDDETGFTLSEEGADPEFGALYFRRIE